MSHIKSKNTSIEMMVRRRLFAMGYRYRVNYKALPGKPDIVFTKKENSYFYSWMLLAMDMIAGAGTPILANQTKYIGVQR